MKKILILVSMLFLQFTQVVSANELVNNENNKGTYSMTSDQYKMTWEENNDTLYLYHEYIGETAKDSATIVQRFEIDKLNSKESSMESIILSSKGQRFIKHQDLFKEKGTALNFSIQMNEILEGSVFSSINEQQQQGLVGFQAKSACTAAMSNVQFTAGMYFSALSNGNEDSAYYWQGQLEWALEDMRDFCDIF